jgi:hypothetical protein
MNFLVFTVVVALVEAALYFTVNQQRRSFPWLITKRDELPVFDFAALRKYMDYSFDSRLGWVRKTNSTGVENGQKGPITFHIDSTGSRINSYNKSEPIVAAFGDSYAFCRQVEDDETWEAQLSRQENFGVLNYGVGNYGIDQALLRYEGMTLPDTVKVVVMNFVPETICRIQSYWKHYLEFGNTFAFKPRFIFNMDDKLTLVENAMRGIDDFTNLKDKLPEIQKSDIFYQRKFRSQQFRFPYIFSLMRNPLKQIALIFAVALRGVCRAVGISNQRIENSPFMLVMKNNLEDAYRLYRNTESTKLLRAILARFQKEAEKRGHIPLIVLTPQLLDLKLNRNRIPPYQRVFLELARQLPVLDITAKFLNTEFDSLYINDQYGGHLSVEGNRLVAAEISTWWQTNRPSAI